MAFNVKKRGKLTYYYDGDRPDDALREGVPPQGRLALVGAVRGQDAS